VNPEWFPQIEVLVVEDDPFVRESFQIYLQTEGFKVTTAKDGVDGLESVKNHEPDVIIADLRMPRMDGIELLRAVKTCAPEVEVILASGSATLESALDAMRLGAYSYIEKPVVDLDRDLKMIVSQAAERRRLRGTNLKLQGELQKAHHQLEELNRNSTNQTNKPAAHRWLRSIAKTPFQIWRENLLKELCCDDMALFLRRDDRLYPFYSHRSEIDAELESLSCRSFPDPGETCREVERAGLLPPAQKLLLFPLFLFGRLEGLLAVPDRPGSSNRELWKSQIREFGDIAVAHICAKSGSTSTTTG